MTECGMRNRTKLSRPRGFIIRYSSFRIPVVLCLVLFGQGGCVRDQIRAARRQSQAEFRARLASVSAAATTPSDTAQIRALRQKSVDAEWTERGYRVGNERGADKIPYSAMGKGLKGLWYLGFTLPRQTLAFYLGGDNPNRAAQQMLNERSPDARRSGISDLIRWDFAQEKPYVLRYRQVVKAETDPLVKATAIRALNRARDPEGRPLFIEALSDPSPVVRMEAANALRSLPDPAAAAPLVNLVTRPEEERDVRVAAADALQHYKTLEVARALIPRLAERDFSVAWQAHESLRTITGKDFGYSEAAWLQYVTGPEKPFG